MAPGTSGEEESASSLDGARNESTTSAEDTKKGADHEETDEEDEEEEPQLKYASLTRAQGSLYRNADAASAFLVAGDKMIIGTHNGTVNVLALPSFKILRVYHPHSASVSSISISPFPPPLPATRGDASSKTTSERQESPARQLAQPSAGKGQKQFVPNVPSNAIYIATSSIDGNICVYSLVDPDDVVLRKFGRPVQSVALSPSFKQDRTYISGGLAGNLILTVGGKIGKSETTNVGGAAAATAGWLGAMGLGNNTGVDTSLHHGEGTINTIKWSLSGRYVVWINEYGIKIMRTNLYLESNDSAYAWKRMGLIDRPDRPGWEEMAGVWRARAEWIDEDGLEQLNDEPDLFNGATPKPGDDTETQSIRSNMSSVKGQKPRRKEKLVVGWGGTIWIINVHSAGTGLGKDASERKIGRVEVVTILRTDGIIISGVSLYTPNLLLVLAFLASDDNHGQSTSTSQGTPKKGITRRQNALQPEMRIINIETEEEIAADTLNLSRFESLTPTDYHLGILPVVRESAKTVSNRGALEAIGRIGNTVWDASLYSGKLLGTSALDATLYSAQLLSSGASLQSATSSSARQTVSQTTSEQESAGVSTPFKAGKGPHPALLTRGMKIFIQSPYDCILATKPTLTDHLAWLVEHENYEEAWNILDSHPEAASGLSDRTPDVSTPSTPTKAQGSLAEFFDDSSQSTPSKAKNFYTNSEREKRHVGGKWVEQLVKRGEWEKAGRVCGKVLQTSSAWEHWIWVFAEADKHSEISPYIPVIQLRPPISPTAYEVILGHYISRDPPKLVEALDRWPVDLFDASSIISAIEGKLKFGDVREDTVEDGIQGRDWRILMDGLAKLYLAYGRAHDALRCYIKLQNAEVALALIQTHHLVEAVADDIPGLLLLRVSKEQQRDANLSELEEASADSIRLLVSEAHHGVVKPQEVVQQLKGRKDMQPYLFFYFRALWTGDTIGDPTPTKTSPLVKHNRFARDTTHHLATEGKSLVNDFADIALPLFAEYDRDLLFNFLKTSQSYTLSLATSICEKRDYVPEQVYLLAKEGRTKRALAVIIEKLNNASQAIAFAKEQDDRDLWDDLLEYSMKRPGFVRALLEEVGTAIDPITLVRRIPEGLEIVGLRESLMRMIREYELQDSISEGVARVLRGEVAAGMARLRDGQKRGIKFNVVPERRPRSRSRERRVRKKVKPGSIKAGACCGCGEVFRDEDPNLIFDPTAPPPVPLIAFPCTHTFHLTCLLAYTNPSFSAPSSPPLSPSARTKSPPSTHPHPSSSANAKSPVSSSKVDGRIKAARKDEYNADTDEEEDPEAEVLKDLPALGPAREIADRGVGPKVRYAVEVRERVRVAGGRCPLAVHDSEGMEEI